MHKLPYIGWIVFLLAICPSISEAAFSYTIEGPYVSLDAGGYSRRIVASCLQCNNVSGTAPLKAYGYSDSTRILGKFGLRANLLDAYLTFGGGTLSINEMNGFQGGMAPVFGGGFNLLLYQSDLYGHLTLYVNPDVVYFKTSDTVQVYFQSQRWITENQELAWTETIVKIGGFSRYGNFASYGGISVSVVNGEETGNVLGSADIKERDKVGLFLGANFYLDPSGQPLLFGEVGGIDNNYFKLGIKAIF